MKPPVREYENDNITELSADEIEKRVTLLVSILEHEKNKPPSPSVVLQKRSIAEGKKPSGPQKKPGIDQMFPAQLRSYYASSEL